MRLNVRVQPGSSVNKYLKLADGSLKVWLVKRPRAGEANKALVEFLAEIFDTAKSRIRIIKGEKARDKIVEIL